MITKPTLLIDEKKCKENIEKMFSKTVRNNVDFRPHFKTHQSLEIGRWFKYLGVTKITVSSLEMALYFSEEWNDITVAFPVNVLEIETINFLAKRINLNILIESTETIAFLKKNLVEKVNFFIKIDVGYNRTGVNPENIPLIEKILEISCTTNLMSFKGFLAHAGHTYKCTKREDILAIHNSSREILIQLKNHFCKEYNDLILSLGDTPSCSLTDNFKGIDEIRPGNFVFYDLTQNQIGSNPIDSIAVAMRCPIVAIHKDRNELVIYGGGVHFSKDQLNTKENGIIFGRVVEELDGGTWGNIIENTFVRGLSQEHGIIAVPQEKIGNYKIGDQLIILPVHSCMTSNSMKSYNVVGSDRIIERL